LLYIPQILIVEDEPAVRYLLGRALTDDGYAVTALGTAREALRAVQDVDFEVIILDISLPDADGIDVIRQIHSDVPHVQVLAISGMMVADLLRAVRSAGAAATLMKPTTGEKVREVVRQLLNRRCEPRAITAVAYTTT
jgi:CheY-like chemotaxis protein